MANWKGLADGASVLGRLAAEATPPVIKAYHGSPYDFDRFDASKIGTGEGAQAYGHGLYFAEAEGLGKRYRDAFNAALNAGEQKQLDGFIAARDALVRALRDHVGLHGPDASLAEGAASARKQLRMRIAEAESAASGLLYRPAHLYEVEIAAAPGDMLDYDAPMGDRFPALPVRAAIDGLYKKSYVPFGSDDYRSRNILAVAPHEATGGDLVRGLASALGPKQASRVLMDSGFPGIRYLDGNSRDAGQGTRNYVMFPGTEDQIRILRKYGLLAPVAAGAAAATEQP